MKGTPDKWSTDLVDITAPKGVVHVQIRGDGTVLWVNVDGVCRLRVCQILRLELDDERNNPDSPYFLKLESLMGKEKE